MLLVWFGLLNRHLSGKSCHSVGGVFSFVILVISCFGFEDGVWLLIAPVPVHCLLVAFKHILRCQPRPQFLKWYKTFSWLFGSHDNPLTRQ